MEMNIDVKKSITITSYNMVRPVDETPRETLWLSTLDMIRRQPYSHTRVLYVYPPNKIDNIKPLSSPPTFFDTNVLKESLSKALVPYYPMAGRVKVNENTGRYEIDCNAEGALFIEAETLHKLTDLGSEINPNTELEKELIPTYDYTKKLSTIPLLIVQLTRFKCGGVCLGFSQHHHVADGAAHVGFINSWGRLAKGLDLTAKLVHDRFKYMAPRDPPQVKFLDLHYLEPPLPSLSGIHGKMTSTVTRTFKLSDSQIKVLKQEAMSSKELSGYEVTTFTVLAGHLWRSVCKARKLADDQDVKLYTPVDGRQSLNLPLGFVGNVVVCAASKAKAGDVMHKPLWYATKKISEAVKKMKDSESFRSAIDYIESQPSLEPLIRGEYNSTCPNMSINSWVKMPITESDFGWGAPKFVRNGGRKYEGQSFLLAGENGDGSLLLNINLFTHHMALLEKYLYEF